MPLNTDSRHPGTRLNLAQCSEQFINLLRLEQAVRAAWGNVSEGRLIQQSRTHHTVFCQVLNHQITKLNLAGIERFPLQETRQSIRRRIPIQTNQRANEQPQPLGLLFRTIDLTRTRTTFDGIISLDKLGLEKVYVQAKRWQNTVGRPELQAFYGALAGQKAKRGVFITTSGFTAHAVYFAKSVDGIVLVDGTRLVHLMMDHEVGVTSRLLRLPALDRDYFDEA